MRSYRMRGVTTSDQSETTGSVLNQQLVTNQQWYIIGCDQSGMQSLGYGMPGGGGHQHIDDVASGKMVIETQGLMPL